MSNTVKNGDTVLWRGAWGSEPAKEAKIRSLIKCESEGVKDGTTVSEALWETVQNGRKFIVDLDNGSWAWGFQLSPLE